RPQAGNAVLADVQQREGVKPYLWSVRDFCEQRMLPFAFSDVGSMSGLEFLLQHVEERLFQLAARQRGSSAWLEVDDYVPERDDDAGYAAGADGRIADDEGFAFQALEERAGPVRTRLRSFGDLVDYVEHKLLRQGAGEGDDG